jgi:hypothetical protein
LDPTALTLEQAAGILSAAGGRSVSESVIREHVRRGAPVGADGRIHLVHYTAWLVKELATGEH